MLVRGLIVCALDDPSDGVSANPAAVDVVATCTPGSCPQHILGRRGMGLGFDGAQLARIRIGHS